MTEAPLLSVRDLTVGVGRTDIVRGVSFDVQAGQTVGIVGESGSGKSMTALSATGLFDAPNARIGGSTMLAGTEIVGASARTLRSVHGRTIGFVFQDPGTSLNPLMTLERQLTEAPMAHLRIGRAEARRRAVELLGSVGIPEPEGRLGAYPHQLSGGQRQRVMIAIALACDPDILIADEPTTALDVTTQAQILRLVATIQRERGMGVVWISHDLGVIGQIADEVTVLYRGSPVEQADVGAIFDTPRHDYTRSLLAARPLLGRSEAAPAPAQPEPLLRVDGLNVTFDLRTPTGNKKVTANRDVSFELGRGETLGIVGESGSGKSTIAQVLTGLVAPDSGTITLGGEPLGTGRGAAGRAARRRIAMVFQDPYSALNPRMKIGASVAEPLIEHRLGGDAAGRTRRVAELLELVGLGAEYSERYPHELSGGQRQRACIARALAIEPEVLILDESTASLDVSIQAQVIALLGRLQAELGLSYLFIAHDLAVVEQMSHRVLVMQHGEVVEQGDASALYRTPASAYTRSLIAAVPPERPIRL